MQKMFHDIIFEAETPTGKAFDIGLILCILASVGVVILDSVEAFHVKHGMLFFQLEWIFTIIFTIEYALRLWAVKKPAQYAKSFFGIIDLLAILPTYLSIFLPGAQYFLVIRLFRVLRIFRILKLVQFVSEYRILIQGFKASGRKIFVFIVAVITIVVLMGSLMYTIEGQKHGFTSIPRSIYWAIVTLTTVGYGDISPKTGLGQLAAAIIMLMGYGIIAVPAGIVTSELNKVKDKGLTETCRYCMKEGHDLDAIHCKFCGGKLNG